MSPSPRINMPSFFSRIGLSIPVAGRVSSLGGAGETHALGVAWARAMTRFKTCVFPSQIWYGHLSSTVQYCNSISCSTCTTKVRLRFIANFHDVPWFSVLSSPNLSTTKAAIKRYTGIFYSSLRNKLRVSVTQAQQTLRYKNY